MQNVLFMGWNLPRPGREAQAGELFDVVTNFLKSRKQDGDIDSYEPVILNAHGGDMNGFFLVRGNPDHLNEIRNSDEFIKLVMQCNYALDGFSVIHGYHGNAVNELMGDWRQMVGGS